MLTGSSLRGRRAMRACALAAALVAATASSALAQTTAQIPLQFDFVTPGARSMATGGAFIGAADDATAAFTNAAGVAWLTRREVAVEGRYRSFETPYLFGGRISGAITGIGLDTIPAPVYATDVDRKFRPAFVSVVLPFSRGAVTAYRHDLVTIDNELAPDGVFERFTFFGITDDNNRENPVGGTRSVSVTSYGGTVGYKLSERLAIGGGLSIAHFSLDSSFARFGLTSLFGPVDYNSHLASATQSGHDNAITANVGALWRVNDRLKVGAIMRRGAKFTFSQEDEVFATGQDLVREGQFKVPDVWGAGVEFRPAENLRVLVDYDWVRYEQLKKDFINFQAISSNRQDQVHVDSGPEWHGGVEYQLLSMFKPMALRAGVWRDPAHAPRYESTPQHDELDVLLGATLPGGKTLVHYTFGGGILLSRWLEFNAAADLSSRTTYVTSSAVVRF